MAEQNLKYWLGKLACAAKFCFWKIMQQDAESKKFSSQLMQYQTLDWLYLVLLTLYASKPASRYTKNSHLSLPVQMLNDFASDMDKKGTGWSEEGNREARKQHFGTFWKEEKSDLTAPLCRIEEQIWSCEWGSDLAIWQSLSWCSAIPRMNQW